jgi:hypothetical protein
MSSARGSNCQGLSKVAPRSSTCRHSVALSSVPWSKQRRVAAGGFGNRVRIAGKPAPSYSARERCQKADPSFYVTTLSTGLAPSRRFPSPWRDASGLFSNPALLRSFPGRGVLELRPTMASRPSDDSRGRSFRWQLRRNVAEQPIQRRIGKAVVYPHPARSGHLPCGVSSDLAWAVFIRARGDLAGDEPRRARFLATGQFRRRGGDQNVDRRRALSL